MAPSRLADTGSAFPAGQIALFGAAIFALGLAVFSLRKDWEV